MIHPPARTLVGKYQAQRVRPLLEENRPLRDRPGLGWRSRRDGAEHRHHRLPRPDADEWAATATSPSWWGDGTMLASPAQLARYGTPLVGINQGGWASSPTSRWPGAAGAAP